MRNIALGLFGSQLQNLQRSWASGGQALQVPQSANLLTR